MTQQTDPAAVVEARKLVAEWAAVSVDDVGFKIEGPWTYGDLVTRIVAYAAAQKQARP